MTCNWCEDESIAAVLIRTLCGEDRESWKQESNSDLCYCTSCVKEYHRIKDQYIKERPDCEKMLYEMEEERLKHHFADFLSQHGCQTGDDMMDYLKVPSLELLRYPYLLFNVDLMNMFVQCLILLTENGKFHEIDEKLPGVYLLLVNPNSQVRKWALETAKELGTISLEDYHCLSPVIACLLKIILYSLEDYEVEAETWPVPMSKISDDTYPLSHLYRPLPKKDLWLGFSMIFSALEDDVIRRLLNQKGHCQVLGILKNVLESKDPDSKVAFWPVLFCLNVLMTKLESTFWLMTDFEDGPKTVFRLICNHEIFAKDLKSLAAEPFRETADTAQDEITLSQLVEEEENSELNVSGLQSCGQKSCKPFFWILPYIRTILDLENLCGKLTRDVMEYLLSLVDNKSILKTTSLLPTELDYYILKCLCDVVKYLIDHKATHIIKTLPRWTSVMFRLRFQNLDWNEEPPKRWVLLMRKAQCIFREMLVQSVALSADKNLEILLHWLRHSQPGKAFGNAMAEKLEKALPKLLQIVSKIPQDSLSVSDLDKDRLFSFSSEDDFKVEEKVKEEVKDEFTAGRGAMGTYESPIFIGDSDDEEPLRSVSHEVGPTRPTSKEFNCSGDIADKVFRKNTEPIEKALPCEREELKMAHVPSGGATEEDVGGESWYESIGSETNEPEAALENESKLEKKSKAEKEAKFGREAKLEKKAKVGEESRLEKEAKLEQEARHESKSKLEKKSKVEKEAKFGREAKLEKKAKVERESRLEKEAKLEQEARHESKSKLEKKSKVEKEAKFGREAKLEKKAKVERESRLEKEAKLEQEARHENKSKLQKEAELGKKANTKNESQLEKEAELKKKTKYERTSKVVGEITTAVDENGDFTVKNGEVRGENGKDSLFGVVTKTDVNEIHCSNKKNVLIERGRPVHRFYRKSDIDSLAVDSDMNECKSSKPNENGEINLSSVQTTSDDGRASDSVTSLIRHRSREDRCGSAAYTSENRKDDMKRKRKEDDTERKDHAKGSSVFKRNDDSKLNSKKIFVDPRIDAMEARKHKQKSVRREPEICEGFEQDRALDIKKSGFMAGKEENPLKRLSTDKEKPRNEKRRKSEEFSNIHRKASSTNSDIVRERFGSSEVDDTRGKDRSQLEPLRREKSKGTNVEKGMGQSSSKESRHEKESPVEKRGVFDYIGGLQQKHDEILSKNEMFPNVESVSAKEKLPVVSKEHEIVKAKEKVIGEVIEEVIEESSENVREQIGKMDVGETGGKSTEEGRNEVKAEDKGHAEKSGNRTVLVDQNKEAEKKMSTPAFQLKKKTLYNQYVKQQKRRVSHNSNNSSCDDNNNHNYITETTVSGASLSPERKKIAGYNHAMQVKTKSCEIPETVQSMQKGPKVLSDILPDRLPERLQEGLPEVDKHKVYTLDSLLSCILSWCPAWLSNEQDESSASLSLKPKKVENKYKSYDDYMDTMRPLILIEFFAEMTREYRERDREQFDYKFKSFDPVIESPHFRIIHCQSVRELDGDRSTREPMENDLVIVRFVDEHIIEVFGVVEEIEKTYLKDKEDSDGRYSYTLTTSKVKVATLHPGMKISSLQIEIVTSMVSLIRRWEALLRLPKSLLAGDILNPFRPYVYELGDGMSSEQIANSLPHEYNSGQREAIAKITDAVVQAFPLPKLRLLRGPPGTGKTHTLKGLVKNILKSLPHGENSRILICAASNAAVDEIALRLKRDPPVLDKNISKESTSRKSSSSQKSHNCGDFNLLRIGSKSQIDPRNEKISLDYVVNSNLEKLKAHHNQNALKSEIHKTATHLRQLDKVCTSLKMSGNKSKHEELQKKMEEREKFQRHYEELLKQNKNDGTKRDLREEEKRLRNSLLTKADIICCTLSGAGSKHMVNTFRNDWNKRRGTPFACVIIDEAGQCCEPEAMIPLQYGSSKLVLVGDPAQLPATVLSKRALRYGYGQSLFERIQLAFSENKNTESPVLSLQEQYRMHPAICAFPSKQFYNDEIFTARHVLLRKSPQEIKQMVVLNIKSSMEANENNGAIHNPEERKYVVHICNEVIKRKISIPEKIGVITPYRKQLEKLRSEMNDRYLKKVDVNTIDGFQGREKDIVILSCVRAQNSLSGIGFLDDRQRMNVALTRAKHSLILIVHADSLQVDDDWRDLMAFARAQEQFFDITSTDDADNAIFISSDGNSQRLPQNSVVNESKVENTGTKSVSKTEKNLIHPTACGGSTRVPEDGTKTKTGDRKKPSQSYLLLPHDHSDGKKCIDKCVRLEEREQKRLGNMGVKFMFPYIREDSLKKGTAESCISDENDPPNLPRSSSTEKENDKLDESESIRRLGDNKAVSHEQSNPAKPRFDGVLKRKQCGETENRINSTVKKMRNSENTDYQRNSEIKATRGKTGNGNTENDSAGAHYSPNYKSRSPPSQYLQPPQFPLPKQVQQSPGELEIVPQPPAERAEALEMDAQQILGENGEIPLRTMLVVSQEKPLWHEPSQNFSYENCSMSDEERSFHDYHNIDLPFTASRPFSAQGNGPADNNQISFEEQQMEIRHLKSLQGYREYDFEMDNQCEKNPNENFGKSDGHKKDLNNTYYQSIQEGDERGMIASEAPEIETVDLDAHLSANISGYRNSDPGRYNRISSMQNKLRRDNVQKGWVSTRERQEYRIAQGYSHNDVRTRYRDDEFSEYHRKQGKVTGEEMDNRSDRRERSGLNSLMSGNGRWGGRNTETRRDDDRYSYWRRGNEDRNIGTSRYDVTNRDIHKQRWSPTAPPTKVTSYDRYSAASSDNRERSSYERRNERYDDYLSDNILVTLRRSSSPPKRTKHLNGITEISPRKARRSVQSAEVQRQYRKSPEEVAQRIRKKYESTDRRTKLLESYVSVNERQPPNRGRRYWPPRR